MSKYRDRVANDPPRSGLDVPGRLYGAIEAGGTKVNVAVGTDPGCILASARIKTSKPSETIRSIVDFFDNYRDDLCSFGVACFGPVRISRNAPDWGRLLTTPKEGWSGASFVHPLIDRFGLPVELDTDVNAAALAEYQLGALRGVDSGAYITVGTGVGGGLIADGRSVHGIMHPEIGHVRVLRVLKQDDAFGGTCPFHGDCVEGLAAGPAILKRWGAWLSDLPEGHPAHDLVADYLGQACASVSLMLSPGRIVIGGGVSHARGLHLAIAARMRHWLAGYLPDDCVGSDNFIAPPALGDCAGIIGAMLLSQRAAGWLET